MARDEGSLKVSGAHKEDLDTIKNAFSISPFNVECRNENDGIYCFVGDACIGGIIDLKQYEDVFQYSCDDWKLQIRSDSKMKQKALFHFLLLLFEPGIIGVDYYDIKKTIKQNCDHYYFTASDRQEVLNLEERLLCEIYDNDERKADGIIIYVYGNIDFWLLCEIRDYCANLIGKNRFDREEFIIVQGEYSDNLPGIEVSFFVNFSESETV